MNNQRFIRDLSNEEKEEILNYILNRFKFDNEEQYKVLCDSLVNYIINCRASSKYFKGNIDKIIDTFKLLNYSEQEIICMITKEPSLLHEDKDKMLWKILLFAKVYDRDTNESIRLSKLINNPRILRISEDVLYARIKYLESEIGKTYLRKDGFLSYRQIIKCTHEEFKNSYGIDKDKLLELYPFDEKAQRDVIFWKENETLLNNIYEKGKNNEGRSL